MVKPQKIDKNIKWLRELLEILKNESNDPKEFMDLLKIDLYNEQIFVFTPAGDLIQLPVGSTTVDFVFKFIPNWSKVYGSKSKPQNSSVEY